MLDDRSLSLWTHVRLATAVALATLSVILDGGSASGAMGGFSFDDIRVQLSGGEAPVVSRIASGQPVKVIFVVRNFLRMRGGVACLSVRSGSSRSPEEPNCIDDRSTMLGSGMTSRFVFTLEHSLGRNQSQDTIELLGSVTMNGAAQRRRRSIVVYR